MIAIDIIPFFFLIDFCRVIFFTEYFCRVIFFAAYFFKECELIIQALYNSVSINSVNIYRN